MVKRLAHRPKRLILAMNDLTGCRIDDSAAEHRHF